MAETEQLSGSSHEDDKLPSPVNFSFIVPKKEISMVPDMGKWKRSQAYADYMGFILTMNEGVKGKKLTCEYQVSETVEKLLAMLGTLDHWIDETPPVDQPSRFGNKAYRTWYAKLEQEAETLVKTVLPSDRHDAAPEIAVYLKESVGNSTRIDYGTGHEAAFAAFLCCLCKVGALRIEDQLAIVFKVFEKYLRVMRKLQKTYRMEPAGSQGVWGLDDFQFLPFIWGSAQLIDHPTLEPRHFLEEKAVNENHQDYMFLECIKFINEMKTGPFAEHSNQLWNISAVPSWSKVNQGLIRMYKAEATHTSSDVQQYVWNKWPALLQKPAVLVAAGCIMCRCRECLCTAETLLRKWRMGVYRCPTIPRARNEQDVLWKDQQGW
ncbi:serine/threonine-protein phosphatase 2A activator isoform X2 [Ctenopharyngodon idella]|uniref:serine/threonine-protein phosphatase 2A activator isoform X2 n=1 Tax=Ctenopharyngodon idella TaxID=7959 RepID=UPI0022316798|nr:serine/threonine-protein phosphatase 2A activator isoform X2 [Ctenopharyngodon idella]